MNKIEEVKEDKFIDMTNDELAMEAKRLSDAHTALKNKLVQDLDKGYATLLEFESKFENINRVLKSRNV